MARKRFYMVLFVLFAIAGCGAKGPLTLPDDPQAPAQQE